MTTASRRRPAAGLIGEYLLMIAVLASVYWVVSFYANHHYLPQPFVPDVNDTFMDWFNTAYYADRPGAYDVWHTVYPPLSFVFLRLFSISRCYTEAFAARDCDWLGTATILVAYAVDCVLAAAAFRRRDRSTALPRTLAFAAGLPLLFSLERGNLILACLIPFILAYGDLLTTRFSRGLAIATTINFKPYLLVPWLALAIRRDWRGLELAGLATLAVYLATLMLFGSGTIPELIANTRLFANVVGSQFWAQSYLSTSYATLLSVSESPVPVLAFVASNVIDFALWLIPVLIAATQFIAIGALVAAWLQPRSITLARNAALLTGAYLCTQSPGGYTLVFLVFLVFLEDGRRPGQVAALIAAYALSISFDYSLATVIEGTATSWLSGWSVHMAFGLAVGQFVRPGLVIVIVWGLAIDTITLSILAHRHTRGSLGLAPAGTRHLA